MTEEQANKPDRFDLTREGETLGYIGMDQAQVKAMQVATETPGDYGSAYSGTRMAFEVDSAQETEDHYVITLSLRPQGDFSGKMGQEQFFIEKEGRVAHRQVLALPRPGRRFPVIPVAIGLAVTGVLAVIAVLALAGLGGGNDEETSGGITAPTRTPTPPPATSRSTVAASATPSATLTTTDAPAGTRPLAPTMTNTLTPTATPAPTATPTPRPIPQTAPAASGTQLPSGSGGTGPDLVIEEVTSQPANPAPGDRVVWEVRVRNQGLGNANGFKTALQLKPIADCPGYFGPALSFGTQHANLNFLGAGQAETVRLTYTVRSGDTYWLVVDSCDNVRETDEGNNTLRIQLSMADLVIGEVTSQPANPTAGDRVVWEVRVRNQGLGNANGFKTALQLKPIADCPGYFGPALSFGTQHANLNFLGAGQAETVRLTYTVRSGDTYWLVVDSCDNVRETDEGNNMLELWQVR